MRGFFQQVVEKYFQFFGKKDTDLKSVQTPSIDDHQIPPEDFESKCSFDDRRLRRLVSYIHHTYDETLQSFVGDHADDL